MSGGILGGDEVGALVVDFGSHTTRAGYAGEDMPKIDFPSYAGLIEEFAEKTEAMDASTLVHEINGETSKTVDQNRVNRRYLLDPMSYRTPRSHMHVQTFLKDGLVNDWDLFEKMLDYTFIKYLRCDTTHHPVLFSEPVTNTKQKREKICELVFEKFQTPGFYLAKNGVLSAFASNRTSGLVLDCGSLHTTAIPIHDGYVLNKAVAQSPLGGEFIINKCRHLLEDQLNIEIVPYYQVKSKEVVKTGDPAKYVKRDMSDLTDSYKRFMVKETVLDFVTHVLQVSDTTYNESEISVLPRIPYEFPNGYNTDFGEERFKIPEALFNSSILKGIQPNSMLDVVHLITSSINMCDAELRSSFFSNIMVVGGNSLLIGFVDRLNNEFNHLNYKTKISAPASAAERRFSSWIGGSILGSLGTFHQMWISKQEYEESGKHIVEKKCI